MIFACMLLQDQTDSVLVLIVIKGASWQPLRVLFRIQSGAAVVSQISTQDSIDLTQIDVYLTCQLLQ